MLSRIGGKWPKLHYIEPLGYLKFIWLVRSGRAVITDSGGITEEATVLSIPCLTLRDNTERPETVTQGTNELIGHRSGGSCSGAGKSPFRCMEKRVRSGNWDGRSAQRIVEVLWKLYETGRLAPHEPWRDESLLFRPHVIKGIRRNNCPAIPEYLKGYNKLDFT